MGAMQAMKKKAVLSARTARRRIFNGLMDKSSATVLSKGDLMKNKHGKVVSKKLHARGQKNPWMVAVVAARKELKIKGLAMVKKGTPLYAKAKELMKKR